MRFRICACTETSSAEVGSSQMRNSGWLANAPRDGDALALAAGELVGKFDPVGRRESHLHEQLARPARRWWRARRSAYGRGWARR